jgi:hypothetical protein
MTPFNRTRAVLHAVAWVAVAMATACAAHHAELDSDSQGHWLAACDDDSTCSGLSCLCGVCTSLCSSELDCPQAAGMAACVSGEGDDACADLGADERICVPICEGDGCGDSNTEIVVHANGFIPSDAVPVPACAGVAATTGLPPFFLRTDMTDYDGFATVNQITENHAVVLVPNGVVGSNLELRFNQPPPGFLPLGLRVQAMFRRVGEFNAEARLLVLRAEDGTLLLASHTGGDGLYQAGLFDNTDAAGVAIELTMACQSPESEGCFINQVQADYRGLFRADSAITLESPSIDEIMIAEQPYRIDFISSSVDGDGVKSDCNSEFVPARYLDFQLLLAE